MTVSTIFADSRDGFLQIGPTGTFSDITTGGTGAVDTTTAAPANCIGMSFFSGSYNGYQTVLWFDFTVLGATPSVTQVDCSLYGVQDLSTTDFTIEMRDTNPNQTLNNTDFKSASVLGSATLLATFATSGGFSTSGYNAFTESSTNFRTFVAGKGGGLGGFSVVSDKNRTSTAPTTFDTVGCYLSEQTGTTNDPKIVVTYTPLPSPPTTLLAVSLGSGRIDLSWVAGANATSYKVERAPDVAGSPGSYAQIGTPAGTSYSDTDAALTNNTTYWYRVRSTNGAGDSGYATASSAYTNAYAGAVWARTPILWWKMLEASGNLHDYSGNGRDGTKVGTTTYGQASLLPQDTGEKSILLNGSTGYYDSSYNPFTSTTRTFEIWVKQTSTTTNDVLWAGLNGTNEPILRINANTGGISFFTDAAQAAQTWSNAVSTTAGAIYHIVLTYTDSTKIAELFVNGVSLGTKTMGAAFNATPGNFKVGARATVTDPADATFQHAVIYGSILTAAQILDLYQKGTGMYPLNPPRRMPPVALMRAATR